MGREAHMSKKFDVNTGNLKNIADDYQRISNSLQNYNYSMQNICNQMSMYSYGNVRNSLSNVIQKNDRNISKMKKMGKSLEQIALQYEQTENRIVNHSNLTRGTGIGSIIDKIISDNPIADIIDQIPDSPWQHITIDRYPGIDENIRIDADSLFPLMGGMTLVGQDVVGEKTVGVSETEENGKRISYKEFNSDDGNGNLYIFTAEGDADIEGLRAYAEGSAAVVEGEIGAEGKYAAGSIGGSILQVEGEASFGIPDSFSVGGDGAKTAGLVLSASGNVVSAEAEGRLGTEKYNVHGEAEGALVGAGAGVEAGLVMEDGQVSLKAEAGAEAYWAKGEVSGGVTIFGIAIDVGVEGMVGVQAEAGGEIGLGGVDLNLGLGPIGLDVAIDWSDFDLTFWD